MTATSAVTPRPVIDAISQVLAHPLANRGLVPCTSTDDVDRLLAGLRGLPALEDWLLS